MTANDVKDLIQAAFENAQIEVLGEGSKFEISIVSEAFEGKRPVPRQQMVYAALNEHIASGVIHAVTMNLKTPSEAA